MKYIAPEFDVVLFETEDIITSSIATKYGENEYKAPADWWN